MRPATELRLLASTAWRMFREDPAWLAVQAARRFAPTRRLALTPSPDARGLLPAVGAYIADQPERAAELLRRRGVSGHSPGDRFAARLAVQVGAPDALAPHVAARPEVRAALAQQRGDLTGALAALEGLDTPTARKLRSEWAMLQPGFRLPVPSVRWSGPGEGIRVLHILTNSLPHTRSGYTGRTHHVLTASREAGLSVEAVTRIGYPTTVGVLGVGDAAVVDGVTYRRLLTGRLAAEPHERLNQQVEALIPLARRFRPTILHTTTDYRNALVTQAVAAALGIPWVYEMRGLLELTWVAGRPPAYRAAAETSERVQLLRAKEAELALAAHAVVALSRVQADDLVARGVPAEQVVVVPNSIDPALLDRQTKPTEARRVLGLPQEGVWAGTVSSLVDYEGLDEFLRAVATVRAGGLDLRGAIVGDGVSRPKLMAMAAELGIADAVLFPGRVSRTDAIRWYQALDVFVVPRRDTPVCRMVTPLKPVEAMALGRPVVASDLPALSEVLDHGAAGILTPAEDAHALAVALTTLAGDESRRTQLGREGRSAVANRTWESGIRTLQRVYQGQGG